MNDHRDDNREALRASRSFLAAVEWLAHAGGLVGAALILCMLGLSAVSVVARYVLNNPILITDEAVGFLVVATVMFGAAEALQRGDHIGIDLLTEMATERVRGWLDVLAHAVIVGFSAIFLASAWHTVSFSWGFEAYSTGALEMPLWLPQSTMLVGACLLGLVASAKLARAVARVRRP